jgi:hypothetical protein
VTSPYYVTTSSSTLSGIAGSRFLLQQFMCMRKPRNAEPQLPGISRHVFRYDQQLQFSREIADRDFVPQGFHDHKDSDIPMSRILMTLGLLLCTLRLNPCVTLPDLTTDRISLFSLANTDRQFLLLVDFLR